MPDSNDYFFAAPPAPATPAAAATPTAPPAAPSRFGAAPPPFGSYAAPPAYAPAYPPAPVYGTPPRKPGLSPVGIAAIALGAVVVIGGMVAAAVQVMGHHHKLALPATADGYAQINDTRFHDLQQTMVDKINDNPGGAGAIAGFYGDNGKPSVMVVAMYTHGHSQSALNGMLRGMSPDLSGPLSAVDAGPRGGDYRCGTLSAGLNVPVCVWVDRDTIGTVVMFDSSSADAPATAVEIRDAVEK